MNSATLSTRSATAVVNGGDPSLLQQLWHSTVVVLGVVFTARHQMQQLDEMRRLLREAHACEDTHATRSAALRARAFALID